MPKLVVRNISTKTSADDAHKESFNKIEAAKYILPSLIEGKIFFFLNKRKQPNHSKQHHAVFVKYPLEMIEHFGSRFKI